LGPLGSTCQAFVNQYVPQLIQWIEKGESPQQFCSQVGLCSSVHKSGMIHHKREVQQAGCSVCQLVVQYVETYLASNQTEAQIVQQLDQVCTLLGPLSSTCQAFVQQYVPQLIQWIENGESPQQFCSQVGLCSSVHKSGMIHHKREVQQGGCSVCELVVQYVESYLASNQTEAQIIQQLDQVCALLGPLGSTCQAFVNQYVPQLIQWIENGENPQQFCTQIGVCSARPVKAKSSSTCSLCELVVSYAEQYIASAPTEAEIAAKLGVVCAQLPSEFYTQECNRLVAAYLPQVVQWLETNQNPQVVCSELTLC
jgi:saposin